MPFNSVEIKAIAETQLERLVGRYQRTADSRQSAMWRHHEDDLIGVPEVEWACDANTAWFAWLDRHQ